MRAFFNLSNFAVTAQKLSCLSENLFQFTSLTTDETRFSAVSLEYDIKRIGKWSDAEHSRIKLAVSERI